MNKKVLALVVAALCMTGPASQAITINLSAGNLYEQDGTTLMELGGTLALIASTQDAVFGDLTLGVDSFATGTDDVVIDRWALDGFLSGSGTTQHVVGFNLADFAGLSGGDPLMLVWYPDVTFSPSATGPGGGAHFGTYRTDEVRNGSSTGWFTPGDNSALIDLNMYTLALTGGSVGDELPESAGIANLQTVPEPSTFGLLALGALGMVIALRKKATV